MDALVIDDSTTQRLLMSRLLRELGFAVWEASNGKEGLAQLGALGRPAVALVDWNMPELDGLTLVQRVRADPRYADVRLVMITTEVEKSRIVAALQAGADEYVMKPFTREMLVEKLSLLGFPTA